MFARKNTVLVIYTTTLSSSLESAYNAGLSLYHTYEFARMHPMLVIYTAILSSSLESTAMLVIYTTTLSSFVSKQSRILNETHCPSTGKWRPLSPLSAIN